MPCMKIRKAIFEEITALFEKYKVHADLIDMREMWNYGLRRYEKVVRCI